MRKTLLFVVVAVLLETSVCFAQDVKADDSNPPASEEEFSLDKMMAELNEPESEKEKTGTDLLDKAMALRLSANTLKDIEDILELSQKAIDKGLSADEEKAAQNLIRSTLLQRAAVTAEILRDGRADSEREVAIIAKIGMDDLNQIKKSLDSKESEKIFDGADAYWYIKATLQAYSGQSDKVVLESIQIAKKLNQDNNSRLAQLLYMEASVKSTDSKKHLELMKQAYEKNPESESIERGYIIALARNNKLEEASKLILSLVKDDEGCDPLYALILSDYYQECDQPEKAMEWLNKIPKPAANSIQVIKEKLFCAIGMEDKRQIMDLSMQILNADPQNIRIRILRAKLLMAEEKYDDALQEIRLAMFFEENSKELEMVKTLILCRKDKKNFDDARKAVENVLNENEHNPETLNAAYDVAKTMKEPQLQLQIIEKVIKLDDKNISAYNELPTIYIALKQFDKAAEAFEKSLQLFPDNPTALNNYSWFLATITEDSFRNGKKALELGLKAAKATNYKKAYILSTLGAAYAETGDFENAVKTVQSALKDAKDDKLIEELKHELESYKQNKPIREDSNEWFK